MTPPALSARPPMLGFTICCCMPGPIFPWVRNERVLTVWGEVFDQLTAYLVGKARANADVLQRARVIEKAQQE